MFKAENFYVSVVQTYLYLLFVLIRNQIVDSELTLLSEKTITTPSTIPKVFNETNVYSNEELGIY